MKAVYRILRVLLTAETRRYQYEFQVAPPDHGGRALAGAVHDGDEGLRRGGAPRLAEPDAHAQKAQLRGVLREPAEARQGAPHDERNREQVLAAAL